MAARSAPRELHLEGERGGGLCVRACGGSVGGGACGPLAAACVAGWCTDSRNDVSRGGGERAQDSTDRGGGGGGGGGDSQGLADDAHTGTLQ